MSARLPYLKPQDLDRRPITLTVSNVSLQGVERLQPVLHFTSIDRRLVLDDAQCDAMARITGRALLDEWIGARITLTPAPEEAGATIRIDASLASAAETRRLPTPQADRTLNWRPPLLLLIMLALSFGAVYLIDNVDQLLTGWQQVRAILSGR